MFGVIDVLAGDFKKGKRNQFAGKYLIMNTGRILREKIPVKQIEHIEKASDSSLKNISEAIGMGIAGDLLLGPAGAIAGSVIGATRNQVAFIAKFKDGRKFLGTTDSTTYTKLLASKTQNDWNQEKT